MHVVCEKDIKLNKTKLMRNIYIKYMKKYILKQEYDQ